MLHFEITLLLILIFLIVYPILLSFLSGAKRVLFEPKLTDKEIYKKVKEEKRKLGLNSQNIKVEIYNGRSSECERESENQYVVRIADNFRGRRPATIKHEMYHVYRDKGEKDSTLKRLFIQEPRANLYDIFNICL